MVGMNRKCSTTNGNKRNMRRHTLNADKHKITGAESDFLLQYKGFMKEKKLQVVKIPTLGFKEIDLYAFYRGVQNLGGYDEVTHRKLWKQVYCELGCNPSSTSAATCARRHYERLLLPFEKGKGYNIHERSRIFGLKHSIAKLNAEKNRGTYFCGSTSKKEPIATPSKTTSDFNVKSQEGIRECKKTQNMEQTAPPVLAPRRASNLDNPSGEQLGFKSGSTFSPLLTPISPRSYSTTALSFLTKGTLVTELNSHHSPAQSPCHQMTNTNTTESRVPPLMKRHPILAATVTAPPAYKNLSHKLENSVQNSHQIVSSPLILCSTKIEDNKKEHGDSPLSQLRAPKRSSSPSSDIAPLVSKPKVPALLTTNTINAPVMSAQVSTTGYGRSSSCDTLKQVEGRPTHRPMQPINDLEQLQMVNQENNGAWSASMKSTPSHSIQTAMTARGDAIPELNHTMISNSPSRESEPCKTLHLATISPKPSNIYATLQRVDTKRPNIQEPQTTSQVSMVSKEIPPTLTKLHKGHFQLEENNYTCHTHQAIPSSRLNPFTQRDLPTHREEYGWNMPNNYIPRNDIQNGDAITTGYEPPGSYSSVENTDVRPGVPLTTVPFSNYDMNNSETGLDLSCSQNQGRTTGVLQYTAGNRLATSLNSLPHSKPSPNTACSPSESTSIVRYALHTDDGGTNGTTQHNRKQIPGINYHTDRFPRGLNKISLHDMMQHILEEHEMFGLQEKDDQQHNIKNTATKSDQGFNICNESWLTLMPGQRGPREIQKSSNMSNTSENKNAECAINTSSGHQMPHTSLCCVLDAVTSDICTCRPQTHSHQEHAAYSVGESPQEAQTRLLETNTNDLIHKLKHLTQAANTQILKLSQQSLLSDHNRFPTRRAFHAHHQERPINVAQNANPLLFYKCDKDTEAVGPKNLAYNSLGQDRNIHERADVDHRTHGDKYGCSCSNLYKEETHECQGEILRKSEEIAGIPLNLVTHNRSAQRIGQGQTEHKYKKMAI